MCTYPKIWFADRRNVRPISQIDVCEPSVVEMHRARSNQVPHDSLLVHQFAVQVTIRVACTMSRIESEGNVDKVPAMGIPETVTVRGIIIKKKIIKTHPLQNPVVLRNVVLSPCCCCHRDQRSLVQSAATQTGVRTIFEHLIKGRAKWRDMREREKLARRNKVGSQCSLFFVPEKSCMLQTLHAEGCTARCARATCHCRQTSLLLQKICQPEKNQKISEVTCGCCCFVVAAVVAVAVAVKNRLPVVLLDKTLFLFLVLGAR